MNIKTQPTKRLPHTLSIGGRDIVRLVDAPTPDEIHLALYPGIAKKEVKKLGLFKGKQIVWVCPDCEGTGEKTEDIYDPDSHCYQRGVGVVRCFCENL